MNTIDNSVVESDPFTSLNVVLLESTEENTEFDILVTVSNLEQFSTRSEPLHMVVPLDRFDELSVIATDETHTCQICEDNTCNTSLYSLYGPGTNTAQKLRWDRVHPLNRTEDLWICDSCYTEFKRSVGQEINKSTELVSHIL